MTDSDNVRHLPQRPGEDLPPRDGRDWVTSQELVREAGISYRQLDYWIRTGLLQAASETRTATRRYSDLPLTPNNPGSGYPRRFPNDQLDRARAIHDLLAAGMSLQTIRQVIDQVLEHHAVQIGAITITHHRPQETA